MGLKASDTAELFFDNVRVPHADLVGEVGKGLQYAAGQLPQGRLAIAVASSAVVRAIYEATVRYTKDRNAFGERIIDFQNSRFELADILTEVEVTETYVDQAILAFNAGELDAASAARPSCGRPSAPNPSRTAASSCTAGTATSWNTPWRRPTWPPGC